MNQEDIYNPDDDRRNAIDAMEAFGVERKGHVMVTGVKIPCYTEAQIDEWMHGYDDKNFAEGIGRVKDLRELKRIASL